MCEHPAHQVNVSRIRVLYAQDSSKFFGTPCIVEIILHKHMGHAAHLKLGAGMSNTLKQLFYVSNR